MQKLGKLPLLIGVLLIIMWGASKKINLREESTLTDKVATNLSFSNLDKLSGVTTASWEVFYATARPILPPVISDSELHFIYEMLQTPTQAYFDEPTTQKDKLKALLILFTLKVNRESGQGIPVR